MVNLSPKAQNIVLPFSGCRLVERASFAEVLTAEADHDCLLDDCLLAEERKAWMSDDQGPSCLASDLDALPLHDMRIASALVMCSMYVRIGGGPLQFWGFVSNAFHYLGYEYVVEGRKSDIVIQQTTLTDHVLRLWRKVNESICMAVSLAG